MIGVLVLLVGPWQAGGAPDNIVGTVEDPAGPAYSQEEILEEVANMFGQAAAAAIGSSGVGIVEVDIPDYPHHDRNTIGVNTRPPNTQDTPPGSGPTVPLSSAAMQCFHEFLHTQNCGPDDRIDPTTGDQPAGAQPGDCKHSQMHVDAAQTALNSNPGNLSIAQCYAVAQSLIAADHHADLCKGYGGTPPANYGSVYMSWLEECQ